MTFPPGMHSRRLPNNENIPWPGAVRQNPVMKL